MWAKLADVYVGDAFGLIHRPYASNVAMPVIMREQGKPVVFGKLIYRETGIWDHVLTQLEAVRFPLAVVAEQS